MAMFGKRTKRTSRRALRKAHTKTLKAQARAEKEFNARTLRKSDKLAAKAAKAAKRAKKGGRATRASADTVLATATTGAAELSAKAGKKARRAELKGKRKDATATVRSYLGVAKIVVPVLAPFAYRAASAVRGHIDANRARRIGVGVEQLGEFSGHGSALSARIAGLEPALAQMEPTHLAPADVEFRVATSARLAELSTAVHAAERMPTPRRKGAHRSIAADLDRIDGELLRKLGVR